MIRPYRAHTFGKSYEDEGFTKDGRVLADGAQSCGSRGGYGDAAAHAGKSGGESCRQIAEAGGGGSGCGSGLFRGVSAAGEHEDGGNGHYSEEQNDVAGQSFFIAAFGFLAQGEGSEGNCDAKNQCCRQCDFY